MEPDAPKEVIVLESTATKVTFRVIPPDQKEDLPLLGVRVSFENVQTDFNLGNNDIAKKSINSPNSESNL